MRVNPKRLMVMFWFWPFGAFLMAVSFIRFRKYHSIILLFSFVYGYSVYITPGDIVGYAESFQMISSANWTDFGYLLKQSYIGEEAGVGSFGVISTQPDVYALTLQFLVSRITDNARWFFAIVSLVYTFLSLKFLDELLPEIRWTGSVRQKIFFVYLLVVVPFYVGVTGVRFWSALFLFMIFALRYVKYSRLRDVAWAATSAFVHFTFVFPVLLLLMYRIVRISKFISMSLVLAGMMLFAVTSDMNISNYIQSTSFLFEDTRIEDRIEGYTDQKIMAERAEKVAATNWYLRLRIVALFYFLITTFMIEFVGVFKWKQNEFMRKFDPLYIIFFVVALCTINLGSISRFSYIFYILALSRYTILCGINPGNKTLANISFLLSPVLLLHILVVARAGFYTVDPLLLISPPFIFFFTQSELSLSELLVGH